MTETDHDEPEALDTALDDDDQTHLAEAAPDDDPADADGPTGMDPGALLSQRVGYEMAADMLRISITQLRTLIREGDLPVIQPATGRRGSLIEVSALEDLLARWRVQAQRRATSRAKSRSGSR